MPLGERIVPQANCNEKQKKKSSSPFKQSAVQNQPGHVKSEGGASLSGLPAMENSESETKALTTALSEIKNANTNQSDLNLKPMSEVQNNDSLTRLEQIKAASQSASDESEKDVKGKVRSPEASNPNEVSVGPIER